MKSRQPTLMGQPTPNNANLTTPPFCSLRVGVVLSGGVASVYVKATSEVGEGVRMVRVEKIEGGGGEEGEEGSGVCRGCGDSEENTNEFFTCLQVSCDSQVTCFTAKSVCTKYYTIDNEMSIAFLPFYFHMRFPLFVIVVVMATGRGGCVQRRWEGGVYATDKGRRGAEGGGE